MMLINASVCVCVCCLYRRNSLEFELDQRGGSPCLDLPANVQHKKKCTCKFLLLIYLIMSFKTINIYFLKCVSFVMYHIC